MRDRLLHILADLICRRPWLVVALAALLAMLSIGYASTSLRLNANLDDLLARDQPYVREYRRFLETFGDLEYIIIAIDASRDRLAAERAADALFVELESIPDLNGVFGSVEPDEQLRIATRAMSNEQLRDFALAAGAFPAIQSSDAARVIDEAEAALEQLLAGDPAMSTAQQQALGAKAIFLLEAIASATDAADERTILAGLITPPARQYLRSDTGRLLFINILPAKDFSTLSVIEEPLRRIRDAIDRVRVRFPEVEIGLTGKPVMQYDEMATSNADMTRASIIALLLCAGLFMWMIGGVVRPALAVIAFGFAAAWTYGFATLAVGQLNLLSLVFMLVLVGVGLDYGVHVISRYREFRSRGDDVDTALRGAIVTAVRGNITGALTSSVVFFMALFTGFQGLRELGLIAGGGLILCLIAMCVVLPTMLAIVERRRDGDARTIVPARNSQPNAFDLWTLRHARSVLVAAVVLTLSLAGGAWFRHGADSLRGFEFNLLNLQADGLESIEWERRILADSAAESWFGAAIADDQNQALEFIACAKQQPAIGRVRSVFDVIEPESERRDEWRRSLRAPHSPGLARGKGSTEMRASLAKSIAHLRLLAQAAAANSPTDARSIASLADRLEAMNVRDLATRQAVDAALAAIGRNLKLMIEGDVLPLREALPAAVRDQFVAPDGRLLVMLHPRENVWEIEPMRAFIAGLRAVDPHVTGVPITHFESLGEMRRAFVMMSILALGAIIALLWLDFRSWRDVWLALGPLMLGLLWTVSAMAVLGLRFNLANFFALPMLIGLGVDSAVHILHRWHENSDRPDRALLGHTRRAVVLTSLTTIIGFGALVMAHHRGLRSLGVIMAIGSAACMLASIFVLPALLAWRRESRNEPQRHRDTERDRGKRSDRV